MRVYNVCDAVNRETIVVTTKCLAWWHFFVSSLIFTCVLVHCWKNIAIFCWKLLIKTYQNRTKCCPILQGENKTQWNYHIWILCGKKLFVFCFIWKIERQKILSIRYHMCGYKNGISFSSFLNWPQLQEQPLNWNIFASRTAVISGVWFQHSIIIIYPF